MFLLSVVMVVRMVMVMAVIVIVSAVIVGMIVIVPVIMVVTVVMVMRMIVVMVVVMIVAALAAAVMVVIMVMVMLSEHGVEMFGEGLFGNAIDFADRDAAFGRDLRARFKFRREQRTFAVPPAELAMQLTDRRFDDTRFASTLRALHQ